MVKNQGSKYFAIIDNVLIPRMLTMLLKEKVKSQPEDWNLYAIEIDVNYLVPTKTRYYKLIKSKA